MLSSRSIRPTALFVATLVLQFVGGSAVQVASVDAVPQASPTWPAGTSTEAVHEGSATPRGLPGGQGCTIVFAADATVALAGNNEDWTGLFPKIQFLPATPGKFGRVYFGFDSLVVPQGGMNDRGLFFDMASAEGVAVPRDSSKLLLPGHTDGWANGVMYKAMEECSTVDEVLKYFERYDCSGYWNGQFLVADRFGNSVIIEPLTVIRKTGRYQGVTNFLQSRTPPEKTRDPRYLLAAKLLGDSSKYSVDLIRRVLSATHWEEYSGSMTVTLYSYICDLKRGELYVYNFHDFGNGLKFNLRDELAKGERLCTIASLFSYESFAQRRWTAWRIVDLLYARALEKGVEGPGGVRALHHELCSNEDASVRYEVKVSQLLAAGQRLQEGGKIEPAIQLFEFAISQHPESAVAFQCLGEAQAASGKKGPAIQSYEKSLALDPGNDDVRRKLEELRR